LSYPPVRGEGKGNESVEKALFEKAPIPIIDDGAPGISWIIVPVR
jgi:hypothetical protein